MVYNEGHAMQSHHVITMEEVSLHHLISSQDVYGIVTRTGAMLHKYLITLVVISELTA